MRASDGGVGAAQIRDAQIMERAIVRVTDAQVAAEKSGDGRTTVSTADLKLVLRMLATLFRKEVARAE